MYHSPVKVVGDEVLKVIVTVNEGDECIESTRSVTKEKERKTKRE